MDLKNFLMGLSPKQDSSLTVDNTAGGVGFDPAKLTWGGLPAKVVRCTVEGGDIRCRETGAAPTAIDGDLWFVGDEHFVIGIEAVKNFRAIRTGVNNGSLWYTVYF